MLFGVILLVSVTTFAACGWDKARAVTRGRRVPERVLLGLALLGGSPGLLVGMAVFRHKTRSPGFLISLAAISLLQLLWLTW
jgi:uncharacterized membrane protein YsdA (DUF1294 family)